jgi:hypothetical protein
MNVSILRHYEYLASQYYWHDLSAHFQHDYFISRGYSQGDAVYIVKIDGLTKEYRSYINNLFWDCPISGSITVDNKDFYFDELLDDCYSWNIDKVKEKINGLDISETSKAWIIENLPEYPDYF